MLKCQNSCSGFHSFSLQFRILLASKTVDLLNAQIAVAQHLLEKHRYLQSGHGRKVQVSPALKLRIMFKFSSWWEKQYSNSHERKKTSNNFDSAIMNLDLKKNNPQGYGMGVKHEGPGLSDLPLSLHFQSPCWGKDGKVKGTGAHKHRTGSFHIPQKQSWWDFILLVHWGEQRNGP